MKRLNVRLLSCIAGAVLIVRLLTPGIAQAAAWTVVPSPNVGTQNELHAVASISSNDVWAVGDVTPSSGPTQTVIEQWNGTSWSVVTSPNPNASQNVLDGAAADPSSGQAWAVGDFFNTTASAGQTLTEFNP